MLEALKTSLNLSNTTMKGVTLENAVLSGSTVGVDNTMGDGFVLEDGDGTEVTITENKEVKFIEGTGIDINWTNALTGSDSNPYDLTFTVDLEGTELKSTGEGGGSKFLREDGDGTCSWQTVSTAAKFILTLVGWGNCYEEDEYYARDPYDTRNDTWDYKIADLSAASYVTPGRSANFTATSACKVTKLRGWVHASHAESVEINIWKTTPSDASNANVEYTQIGSTSSPSATTANRIYSLSTTYSSGNTLSAGDVLLLTIRKTSGGDTNDAIYFNISLEIEYT
jgi:hypothetical protein